MNSVRRPSRSFSLLALLSALITTAALLVGSPANAACGSACNNKDPQTYPSSKPCGGDATTAKTFSSMGRTLQLRYSPSCRTVWARIYGAENQDKVILERWEGMGSIYTPVLQWEYFGGNEWSPMYNDSGVQIRACLQLQWATTPASRLGCTGHY
jgi:hypothetical protein